MILVSDVWVRDEGCPLDRRGEKARERERERASERESERERERERGEKKRRYIDNSSRALRLGLKFRVWGQGFRGQR